MSDYERVETTARHGGQTANASWLPDTGRVLVLSALLLIPCFWQPHIQAGDLASHLYNAWLASEIQQGRLAGFVLVPVWTNVLTDWIMTTAVARVGVALAERLVVAPAVLTSPRGCASGCWGCSGRPRRAGSPPRSQSPSWR